MIVTTLSLVLASGVAPAEAAAAAAPVPAAALLAGWLAGSIGIVCGWPQVWKLWVNRRDAGLSLSSSVMGVLYTGGWTLYGVASDSVVQTATGAVGLAGAALILAGHVKLSRPAPRAWAPLLTVGLAVLAGVWLLGRTPVGVTASTATIAGVLPQVYVLARGRRRGFLDASGVSTSRWLLSSTCNVLWVVYAVFVGDRVVMICASIIAALAVAIVLLARTEPADGQPVGASTAEPAAASA